MTQHTLKRASLNYGEALRARKAMAEITLGGEVHQVKRARLGLSFQLSELLASGDVITTAVPYVALASGVPEDDFKLEEVAEAFNRLVALNQPAGIAALARMGGGNGRVPPAFTYAGRGVAAFVHDLAYCYGWTSDYILDELTPEEAWCYLQEIHLDRHQERKWHYSLSQVGRDKRGRQKEMRDPPWFLIGYEEERQRRRPSKPAPRPTGTVIDLNALAKKMRRQET